MSTPASQVDNDRAKLRALVALISSSVEEVISQHAKYNSSVPPLDSVETTPFDECVSVGRKEFVQHRWTLSISLSPVCAIPNTTALTAFVEESRPVAARMRLEAHRFPIEVPQ